MSEEEQLFLENWTFYNSSNGSNFSYVEGTVFSEGPFIVLIIYCILFLVAAVGNLTVFFSLFKTRHRKSRISLMILHLTIADLVVTFIMIPLEVGWRLTVQWIAGNTACKAFLLLRAFGLYLSSNVLVCVSLDRYFAVLHPLKVNDARRRGKCMLAWAWSISLLCAIPQSIVFHVASHPENPNFVQCVTFGFFSSELQQMAYNLFGVIVMYFIPLIVITVAYTAIICEISKKSNDQEEIYQSTGGRMRLRRSDMSNIERARTRTLRMTITIVVVFVICWTPYVFMALWYTFDTEGAKKLPDLMQDSLFMMAVSNSCMNPLVYGSYAIDLRRGCLKCFCCCRRNSQTNLPNGQNAYLCTQQNAGLRRRLFKCLNSIQKVGSGVTRSTGTLQPIGRRSPTIRNVNDYQPPTMIMETPIAVNHLSFLSEQVSKRGCRVSFHSDPFPCNDTNVLEISYNSDTHVPVSL